MQAWRDTRRRIGLNAAKVLAAISASPAKRGWARSWMAFSCHCRGMRPTGPPREMRAKDTATRTVARRRMGPDAETAHCRASPGPREGWEKEAGARMTSRACCRMDSAGKGGGGVSSARKCGIKIESRGQAGSVWVRGRSAGAKEHCAPMLSVILEARAAAPVGRPGRDGPDDSFSAVVAVLEATAASARGAVSACAAFFFASSVARIQAPTSSRSLVPASFCVEVASPPRCNDKSAVSSLLVSPSWRDPFV